MPIQVRHSSDVNKRFSSPALSELRASPLERDIASLDLNNGDVSSVSRCGGIQPSFLKCFGYSLNSALRFFIIRWPSLPVLWQVDHSMTFSSFQKVLWRHATAPHEPLIPSLRRGLSRLRTGLAKAECITLFSYISRSLSLSVSVCMCVSVSVCLSLNKLLHHPPTEMSYTADGPE